MSYTESVRFKDEEGKQGWIAHFESKYGRIYTNFGTEPSCVMN